MNFDKQPWYIVDIKEDEMLGAIEDAQEFDYKKKLPNRPGLYITHPLPHEREEMEDFLWRVWRQEKTGMFFDESYLVHDGDALRALHVTGRSKKIPIISVSQRPVQVPRHVFSEADFYAIFHLNDKRDKKTVNEFYPGDLDEPLPKYSARWYQVSNDAKFHLTTDATRESILERFRTRLRSQREWNGFI